MCHMIFCMCCNDDVYFRVSIKSWSACALCFKVRGGSNGAGGRGDTDSQCHHRTNRSRKISGKLSGRIDA